MAWTSEGWIITIGGQVRWQQNWEWLYGELSPGSYRVGKEILNTGVGGLKKQMSYAVFVIEE